MVAAGPPQNDAHGFDMVPVWPRGAVELALFDESQLPRAAAAVASAAEGCWAERGRGGAEVPP